MTRMTAALLPIIAAIILAGAGCQAPSQPTGPTLDRVAVFTDVDRDRLWEAACDSLRAQRFTLDRQDRTNGVIVTAPETTAQAFELWRPQPRPAYAWWEANLHTIQRQVTIKLIEEPQEMARTVNVEVERFRYRLEERQIDNAAGAMRLYSADAPTVSGKTAKPSKTHAWIPLGRDETLEKDLLADILKRYRQGFVDEATTAKTQQPQ